MNPSDSIVNVLAARHPLGKLGSQDQSHVDQPMNRSTRREAFPAWSAIDEVKKTAAHEFEVASQKAQQKTGHIEPWTAKYYAACTFGGMLACVSNRPISILWHSVPRCLSVID